MTRTPAPWDRDDDSISVVPGAGGGGITQQTGAITIDDGTLGVGTSLGEYRIERIIGQGGMGVVYSAVHPLIGKRAAIKILKRELCTDPTNLERFMTEARVVNEIGHPNIVDIFAFGEMPDGRCYFVMEWLKGQTLREAMARGRMSIEEISAIIKPLTRALEAAHAKRIVHRDLKPDNVYLVDVSDERPKVKLLDFGIAKLGATTTRIEKTATGAMMGTPQYIAPEQAKGYTIDHRADIYALGGMLFEMLVGRPPFVADNAMEIVAKHLMETPPRPSQFIDVPGVLDELVFAMLAKDPAARPSLVDIRNALDIAKKQVGAELSVEGVPALPPSEWPQPSLPLPIPSLTSGSYVRPLTSPVPTPVPLVPSKRAASGRASSPALRPSPITFAGTEEVTTLRRSHHDMLADLEPTPHVASGRRGLLWLGLLVAAAAAAAGTFFLVDMLRDDSATTTSSAVAAEPTPTPVETAPSPPPEPAGSQADIATPEPPPEPPPLAPGSAQPPPDNEPKPATVKKGALRVQVRGVARATILVDNAVVATGTSFERQLPFGEHVIEVRAPGMVTQKRTVQVGKAPSVTRLTLVPVRRTPERPTKPPVRPIGPTDENGLIQPGTLPTKKEAR